MTRLVSSTRAMAGATLALGVVLSGCGTPPTPEQRMARYAGVSIHDHLRSAGNFKFAQDKQSNVVAYYKVAFERATNQLSIANSNTFRANEVIVAMRKAVDDRNDVATRLNDMNKKYSELMNERNEIVGKFNAFMQEVDSERKKENPKDKK